MDEIFWEGLFFSQTKYLDLKVVGAYPAQGVKPILIGPTVGRVCFRSDRIHIQIQTWMCFVTGSSVPFPLSLRFLLFSRLSRLGTSAH